MRSISLIDGSSSTTRMRTFGGASPAGASGAAAFCGIEETAHTGAPSRTATGGAPRRSLPMDRIGSRTRTVVPVPTVDET